MIHGGVHHGGNVGIPIPLGQSVGGGDPLVLVDLAVVDGEVDVEQNGSQHRHRA